MTSHNRICLITGTTSGIGLQTVIGLAQSCNPCSFILINRNKQQTVTAVREVHRKVPDITILATYEIDLLNMEEVIHVSQRIRLEHPRIDLLILNAGIMMPKFQLTKIGLESQIQVNFVSNKILIDILLPSILNSSFARVICLSSIAHQWCYQDMKWLDLNPPIHNYGAGEIAYGESKLAVMLWIRKMAAMHKNISFFSVHPGICRTNLFTSCEDSFIRIILKMEEKFSMFSKSATEGAETIIHIASTDKSFLVSGGYYADSKLQFVPSSEPEKTKKVFKLADQVLRKTKKTV